MKDVSKFLVDALMKQKQGKPVGVLSACTANNFAIKASFKRAWQNGLPAVIEATANQVDQNGGYTGMTPSDFVIFVKSLAREMNFPENQIIFGGDHLGPLTRTNLMESQAMEYAEALVTDYVLAGFTKIHIDTSMRLASDSSDQLLADRTIAERGAVLCKAAERAYQNRLEQFPGSPEPVYIIGSEVPIPGGAQDHEEGVSVTLPENCKNTYETFKDVFIQHGLEYVLPRVIAIVVQPGVEFGDDEVFQYDPQKARDLVRFGKEKMPIIYEGHSTDYQSKESLKSMVQDGIAILKVGPALTFALREALFALELIEREIYTGKTYMASNFREVLEISMLNDPGAWKNHYHGDAHQQKIARKFSYSDRARYYLPNPQVEKAIQQLILNINQSNIPLTVISQYLPREYQSVSKGLITQSAEELIIEHIGLLLDDYYYAIKP